MAVVTVFFAEGGNSDSLIARGFSHSEPGGRWTEGVASALEIPGLRAGGSGRIRVRFAPYTFSPSLPWQRLRILVESRLVYEGKFAGNSDVTITLPRNSIDERGVLRLRFEHPDAASPAAIGLSNDGRQLAFIFWDISVDDGELEPASRVEAMPTGGDAAPSRSSPKVAAVTMVYNENEYLPIWLSHYGRQVGLENCFVVDHGSDDGSTDFIGPTNRIKIPRSPYEPHKQSFFNSKFCNSLLEWYDWVIYSDVDEILVVDSSVAPSLRDYCTLPIPRVVTAIGLNVVHRIDHEPPLNLSQPIAVQRPYVFAGASMCKPLLMSKEIAWSPGSHSSDAPMVFDHLYLFHLRWYDFGSCMRRLQKTRAMAWARTDAGRHQRVQDEEMERQFAAFARMPALDDVEFSPHSRPVSEFLAKILASHKERQNELYKLDLGIWGQHLWRMPERFMIF